MGGAILSIFIINNQFMSATTVISYSFISSRGNKKLIRWREQLKKVPNTGDVRILVSLCLHPNRSNKSVLFIRQVTEVRTKNLVSA